MIDRLMNQVQILEAGLDAAALRNDCIASNIANADTVGYKSKNVEFESVFRDLLQSDYSNQSYKKFLNTTDGKTAVDLPAFSVAENNMTSMRMDGNNVDIDAEMTELAKNSVLYEALTYSVSKELGRIKLVISEGR